MFLSHLFDVCIVFCPTLGYIAQYRVIWQTRSCEGFSLLVSLILLAACALRCVFWFGVRFATPLLLQAVAMMLAQLLLVHLCTRYPSRKMYGHKLFHVDGLRHFWGWEDFPSYLTVLFVMVSLCAVATHAFQQFPLFFEMIGCLSLTIEASLAVPQLLQNYARRSTEGLSRTLAATWILGDLFKFVYFVLTNAPLQFSACALFQIAIDIAILSQLFFYPSTSSPPRVSPISSPTFSPSGLLRSSGVPSAAITSAVLRSSPSSGSALLTGGADSTAFYGSVHEVSGHKPGLVPGGHELTSVQQK